LYPCVSRACANRFGDLTICQANPACHSRCDESFYVRLGEIANIAIVTEEGHENGHLRRVLLLRARSVI
jgi:hypothetical protein